MTALAGHLYLIGYRATGKSTLAPLLARRLDRTALDTDALVLRAMRSRNVAFVWAAHGEPFFRTQESVVLLEHSARPPAVVATGGGIVLDPANRELLRATGSAVWLRATPETILERLSHDPASEAGRPRLAAGSLADEVRSTLAAREPLYREVAAAAVDTDHLAPAELVERVLALFTDPGDRVSP